MFQPNVIAIDFETALLDGSPSTETYRPDFRAISCAFAWSSEEGPTREAYKVGEPDIEQFLSRCLSTGASLVVHNVQFEYSVILNRFPALKT